MLFIIFAIKAIISLFLYLLSLILLAILSLLFCVLSCILPTSNMRKKTKNFYTKNFPIWFMIFNSAIAQISTRNKWDVRGQGELDTSHFYLMISNHRSWIDILVLCVAFKGTVSPLKFFMKKELLWQLPLAGIACHVLGYPFMSRHTHAEVRKNPGLKRKDIETTKLACKKLKELSPTTLINFLEGTRFTEAKKERQQSPFLHLLKPHTGGIATTIQELHDILAGIVNVTIAYPGKTPSVWEFVCGRFDRVVVRYEVLPITSNLIGDYYNDREFRANMQQWLNEIWLQKDSFLQRTLSCKN